MSNQISKKTPKSQNTETWLHDWEIVYNKAVKLKIPDVDGQRPFYDFRGALSGIDSQFAVYYNVSLGKRTRKGKDLLTPYEVIEEYRHHRRNT